MHRNRSLLLIAWGLLAVGAVIQVVRSEGAPDPAGVDAEAADALAFGEADGGSERADDTTGPGGRGDGSTDGTTTGSAGRSAGDSTTDRAGGGEVRFADPSRLLLDDPGHWDEAGVVLATEAWVATVTTEGVAALAGPEAGPVQHWFPNPTQFGGPRVFLVLDRESSPDWVKVSLPVKPNGQVGWIPRAEVELSEVRHRALVDLSDHSVTVWDGDGVVIATEAVIGRAETPTPVDTVYVRDIITRADPDGMFGPHILALSGFSEVLETFQGGLPALAIHGTDTPSEIGTGRSAGCIRIPNELITVLAESVPLGTPVTIVA